jgi:hypothetical protein
MHGLDLAPGWTRRASESFDTTVVRIGFGPRNQAGQAGGGNTPSLSDRELGEEGHQNMLDAWQTNSTQKAKRERPYLGNEDRLPSFPVIPDLDGHLVSAKTEFEFLKKSTFSGFEEIGVSRGNQRSWSLATSLEHQSPSQCAPNNCTNSVGRQTLSMQKPTSDFSVLIEGNPLERHIEMKHIICAPAFRLNRLSHFDLMCAAFTVARLTINNPPGSRRSWRKSQSEEIFSERKVRIIKRIVLQLIAPFRFHVVDLR